MIDIIERLQQAETRPLAGTDSWVELWKVLSDARIELTRLEAAAAEIERLRLTDAEREAIFLMAAVAADPRGVAVHQGYEVAATLRGLLERTTPKS